MTRATAFALVTFAFTATMLGATLPTPLYPLYQERFHVDKLMLTVIYATYAAGVITALVLFGPLSDRIGRRRMLLLGLRLAAASAVAFLIADSVITLLAGRALSGLAAGTITGTATAALVDLAPGNRPGRASLVAAAANMGGLGLGPLLAGVLAQYAPQPLRLCFLVNLVLVAIAAIGIEMMPQGRQPDGKLRLRVQPLRVPAGMRSVFVRAVAPGFAGFAVLGLFTAVSAALLGAVVHHPNRVLAGVLASAGFGASLIGQAISTTMTERRALPYGCAVLIIATGLVITSLAATSLPLLVAAAVTAGIGQGISFRAGLGMVTANSPTGQRAAVASSYFTTLYIALSIPVIGVGAGAQSVGWANAAIVFAGLVSLLPLVALVPLMRREQRPPLRMLPPPPQRPALPSPPQRATPLPRPSSPLPAARPRLQLPAAPPRPQPVPLRRLAVAQADLPPPWHMPPSSPYEPPPPRLPHPWRLPPQQQPRAS